MKNLVTETEVYKLITPKNYPKDGTCYEVYWKNIFMPFDVVCGVDSVPPDNNDYNNYKKSHWWTCPKTKSDMWSVHDISMFMELPSPKEFKKLEDAIKYCLDWRKEWLEYQISINI